MLVSVHAVPLLLLLGLTPPEIATDGDFSEWTEADVVATDPSGDATAAFDVTSLSAIGSGSELRLRFDTGSVLNLQSGPSSDGTIEIVITTAGGVLTIDLRRRFAYEGSDPTSRVAWVELGFESAPTYSSDEHELVVDLARFGVGEGSEVAIELAGSDSLEQSGVVTMGPARGPETRRSADRAAGTDFRIVSQNVLWDGLSHPVRGPGHARLIDAIDADIYCFQEETNSDTFIRSLFSSIDPFDDGAAWNLVRSGSDVIMSRSPITPIDLGSRYVIAAVDLPGGPVVVANVHLKCCGFDGDSSDLQRIVEIQRVVTALTAVREGRAGPDLLAYANAPVVVLGDYNLVGSRTPLDLLESSPEPDLRRWPLRHLIGNRAITWRSDTSSFWPGQLDILAFSPESLIRRNGFVLDTAALNAAELASLGLEVGDSSSSDHLTLVADFSFGFGYDELDFDRDLDIDTDDLRVFTERFVQLDPFADWNDDNALDFFDFVDLLAAFDQNDI